MSDYRFALLVLSDSRSKDPSKDKIKPIFEEIISKINGELVIYDVIPDEFELIKKKLIEFSHRDVDVIITSGGTGLYPRDVTPDATREVLDFEIPGIVNAILFEALKKTKRAMLTRMVAGSRNRKLIINLPGSPRAVREDLEFVLDVLPHAVDKLKGDPTPCGSL